VTLLTAATGVPQVLHGATGLTDNELRTFIDAGIKKINFSSVLKGAYADALSERANAARAAFEPHDLLCAVRRRTAQVVAHCVAVTEAASCPA
jgi:fructose/tagatose bisphosphate aldolase